ncbi:MAG: HAMP domain-containing histidine kinase [Flavobacterium sp.]|jgi:two-component system phosphate regulon sensor histidine kinase PhoR|uniref:sensor histidine kinase n=1 Tax=Flavobacterium sp. TaxID=239 RepID=UPI001B4AEF49|nr:HAMP domain-containing sensor histidine kinase [Flavobacterium sp.]MBP6146573.1 HAMP domain-containing histidine kinase [Flavobacterium sp.]MBP7181580.1 HAMP domain-containing histidine kinase [Flavobacterium sp.]MBP7316771.1 HAMP domain-containing histidine kinase [Flavobacterium sp.]MBP8886256.1 HAMP domain-containing histidine kinase [Flavobacterium sp.]HRL70174.1 HAMP domain-containing sensor histidine kinase [Flavobacterium sp.]
MNKLFFRLLVFLMSLSLIGIILVQVYWFNTSFKNNDEQFKIHVKQVISDVADKIQKQETYKFYDKINHIKDSTGKLPKKDDLLEFYYVQKNPKTNKTIVYSNSIISEDYNISPTFFDKKFNSEKFKSFSSKRVTEVYNNNSVDNSGISQSLIPDVRIEKSGNLDILDNAIFEISAKDVLSAMPLEERVSVPVLQKLIKKELEEHGVETKFEFGIYSNNLATKIKSNEFKYDKDATYSIPVFIDNEGSTKYELLVTFPLKKKFLLSELISITVLSIIFTLIILIAYSSALNQLIRQRQISEIKNDFINNMTHEFKTPIATINLALDAIKNPKIIDDKEKVLRYLQMIKDENKRMHAQVENVLRISKLEKKELDIVKEPHNIHEIIEDAIEHVNLILADREGTIISHFNALRNTVLINDVHFTNVIVNILENAIKYSPNVPEIEICTENIKDMIIIKIKDKGLGMSKAAQKRIFEKFYREHTGDIHNVKGHGLGLSYVKRIVDDHNGQVYVESEKGKGSTFIIKLPLIN